MQFQKFSRFFVATIFSITFFLSSFTTISVSATSTSNESDFWHGFYVEHVTKEISGTGVDIGNAESTDYGITTGNYIYNKTGVTTQDVIDYVSEQYSNATGYVVNSASDYADKVKNVLNRTINGTLSAGYKAEKAIRTVVDSAGNVYYNVSSTDYWNGIYNRWFNNHGYKDSYTENNNGGYDVTVDGKDYSINLVGYGYADGKVDDIVTNGYENYHAGLSSQGTNYHYFVFSVTGNGKTVYVNSSGNYGVYNQWQVSTARDFTFAYSSYYTQISFIFTGSDGSRTWNETATVYFSKAITNGQNSTTSVLNPYSVGFIQYPLGSKTPIYTDPSLNPSDWIINDNGTVTIDGNDYPALIDENEIDDNGWLDMLNLLDGEDSREMSLKDPWGNPWDTQDDGTALGGFFGNLVKDIQKMFKGIGDKIKEIFQKPIDMLSDLVNKIKTALTEFFTFSPDDLNIDVSFDFDILESIWNAFLQQLGLS